jgi:hypothetical protein
MKPSDAALAKANEEALAKLRAERAAQDARLAAAFGDSGKAKAEKPTRFKMTGD